MLKKNTDKQAPPPNILKCPRVGLGARRIQKFSGDSNAQPGMGTTGVDGVY